MRPAGSRHKFVVPSAGEMEEVAATIKAKEIIKAKETIKDKATAEVIEINPIICSTSSILKVPLIKAMLIINSNSQCNSLCKVKVKDLGNPVSNLSSNSLNLVRL